MRRERLQRLAVVLTAGGALVACAAIAGLEDPKDGTGQSGAGRALEEGDIDISPAELAFGAVRCGDDAKRTITIVNNSATESAPYDVKSADPTLFEVTGVASGNIPPKQARTVDVVTKKIFVGDLAGDVLVSVGSVAIRRVPAKATSSGALLEMSPSVAEFGEVRKQNGGTLEVTLKNVGNRPAVITDFAASGDPEFSLLPKAITVEPNAVAKVTATLNPGADTPAVVEAKFTPGLTETLCGEAPVLTMRGKRITTDVTLKPADWGEIGCTGNANTQPVVISNYSAQVLSYTATLPPASAFAFQGGSNTGSVPAAATPTTPGVKNIVLALAAGVSTTPAARSEDMTVAITPLPAPSGGKVKVHVGVHGTIVAFSPSPVPDFAAADGGAADMKTITFTNTGNEDAYVFWDFDNMGSNVWSHNFPGFPGSGIAKNGGTMQRQVSLNPGATGTFNARVSAIDNPLGAPPCKPLPQVPLKGIRP